MLTTAKRTTCEVSTLHRSGAPQLYVRVYRADIVAYALVLVHGTAGHGGCDDEFSRAAAVRGAIARAVARRDLSALRFRITRPRWWLAGGYPGEYTGALRK